MKILRKKFTYAITVMLAISLILSNGALAASTFSFPYQSYNFSGGVTLGTNQGSAYSSYGTTSGLSARSTYNYKHGLASVTHTVITNNSASSTSVTATAYALYVPAVNVSVFGYHTVSYNGSSTNFSTDVYA